MRLLGRLRERLAGSRLGKAMSGIAGSKRLDAASISELEDLLVSADVGMESAARIAAGVAKRVQSREPSPEEIRESVAAEIAEILEPVAQPMPVREAKPQVILFVGVNGSGKTTTIGKLAAQHRGEGRQVMVAACDTFRAAAVEQLQAWGERAGVEVMATSEGGNAAGLAFDAHRRAIETGADMLLVDTAGRLQNKANLMEELSKIARVLGKQNPEAPHDVVLVCDASIGQNTLAQVDAFREMAGVTGLIMTKLDGSARGGTLVAVAERTGLPVHAIGIGESLEDLGPLEPREFAGAITGASS